jgi:molybdopterin-guanine dinucleotide biosynthesis protein A
MTHGPAVAGLILAGGHGERLGGAIKSEVVIGGVRLLDRVAARLSGCAPLLVAHGRLAPETLRLGPQFVPVLDFAGDYAGPLAGFAGAISFLATLPERSELVVCAAVDTPFLPEDYVARLVESLKGHDAVIASYAGQPYPTNSIWRVDHFLDLPARILRGTAPRSLKSLGAEANAALLDWPGVDGGNPFANINTPDELAEMQRRATHFTALSRE